MDEDTMAALDELRQVGHEGHMEVGRYLLEPGTVYTHSIDYLAVPTLNRSLNLMYGFFDLVKKRNFVAAAPLVRLQLDNVLRFSATWYVDDPFDFAEKVVQGKRVRDLRARDGEKMTDRYLLNKVAVDHPWVTDVYEQTSGYVHLSDKHLYNAVRREEEGYHGFKIAVGDAFLPGKVYEEATAAFMEITKVLFSYMRGWGEWKRDYYRQNPPE
jgi:hypothetical protein